MPSAWIPWRNAARKSPLHRFAAQLQRDEAAVRGRAHAALEHGDSGRSHSSTEADQTSDVRTCQTRFATDPRLACSLISLRHPFALYTELDSLHQKCGRTGFGVTTEDPR